MRKIILPGDSTEVYCNGEWDCRIERVFEVNYGTPHGTFIDSEYGSTWYMEVQGWSFR